MDTDHGGDRFPASERAGPAQAATASSTRSSSGTTVARAAPMAGTSTAAASTQPNAAIAYAPRTPSTEIRNPAAGNDSENAPIAAASPAAFTRDRTLSGVQRWMMVCSATLTAPSA